jgi:hypothetical protein
MSSKSGAYPAADEEARADQAPPDGPEASDPDAMVEVDYGGQTYAVPPELQGALMRHEDYQRQVQHLEAGRQALAQMAASHQQHLADHARLMTLNDHIQQLSKVNWPALQQQDPAKAQQLAGHLANLKQTHALASDQLRHKQAVAAFAQERAHAAQVQQAHAAVSQAIEGWSPQKAGQLAQYAMSQGITPQELEGLADPRLVMILHHAAIGHAAQQQQAAGERLREAQKIRPAAEVGGTGGAPKDPNRMSTEDWIRHRRGQLRKTPR